MIRTMLQVPAALLTAILLSSTLSAESLEGRWKLLAAEDVRASGEVVRKPWGDHPVGSIVVQKDTEGAAVCYIQIMSTDTPAFTAAQLTDQMKAKLTSSYIAYTGPCTYNESDGTLSLKVVAAWTPNYVGTDQKRMFHFDQDHLIFGTLPNTIRLGDERLTRRLTLERVP
jgi:hypothetical protein